MPENVLRRLPSIDQLLRRDGLKGLIATAGRDAVRDGLRDVLADIRREVASANGDTPVSVDSEGLASEIEKRLNARFDLRRRSRMQRVINATGVVLHTNLGRAPLSRRALEAVYETAGYCNLEYDLLTGRRGKRGSGLEAMLRELTGCEAAAVVNNCAAAVLITLNTLAEGGEVLISRGELIEIGGSFRIPDVITKSGALLREVGTTNRTRIGDYERAINEQTRVILRAHPSNYRIIGFTEKPSLDDLANLARERNLPLFEDLGSGCLIDLGPIGVHDEPTVAHSIKSLSKAGSWVISFSGDKLLGGPQAGIILGDVETIKRIKTNPLMRALRVDKLTYAALEATIDSYLSGRATEEIPALVSLHITKETIANRAHDFVRRARSISGLSLNLMDGQSVVGGGSAPETHLPTTMIGVRSEQAAPDEIEKMLRNNLPPVIVRIVEDQIALDLRTVTPEEEEELIVALRSLATQT